MLPLLDLPRAACDSADRRQRKPLGTAAFMVGWATAIGSAVGGVVVVTVTPVDMPPPASVATVPVPVPVCSSFSHGQYGHDHDGAGGD